MYIEQLYTNCLDEAACYIESEGEAAIIDTLRKMEPSIDFAQKKIAKIKYVFETHFHADFVSGHLDLPRKVNDPIMDGPLASTQYTIYNAKDAEEFRVGKLKICLMRTPKSSYSLVLNEQGEEHTIITGNTFFIMGDDGRPSAMQQAGLEVVMDELVSGY